MVHTKALDRFLSEHGLKEIENAILAPNNSTATIVSHISNSKVTLISFKPEIGGPTFIFKEKENRAS